MWLTGRLVSDHKTIADFRKNNDRMKGEKTLRYGLCGHERAFKL